MMNPAFKALQLKARHQVYTLLAGQNLSSLHGEGYDFSELREYQIGDDIRKINWTISAKLQKPYIKTFHANRELSVVVATLMDLASILAQEMPNKRSLPKSQRSWAMPLNNRMTSLQGYATHRHKPTPRHPPNSSTT